MGQNEDLVTFGSFVAGIATGLLLATVVATVDGSHALAFVLGLSTAVVSAAGYGVASMDTPSA